MFERLFDFIYGFWQWLIPWRVLMPYEKALVLRLGSFNREIGSGFNWIIPFGIETVLVDNIVPRVLNLQTQSLTTLDGKTIVFSAIITANIFNLKKALLEVEGVDDALVDSCLGVIGKIVRSSTLDQLKNPEIQDLFKKSCHEQSKDFGIRISKFQVTDFSESKTFRLIQ